MPNLQYVLVTPAKNEEDFIEKTIHSILAQSYRPLRWVIVDDASSDATGQKVSKYAQQYPFISLVRNQGDRAHNFASKVHAFNCGLRTLEGMAYDLIGNLDADVIFQPDYYATVVEELERDGGLGICGGPVYVPVESGYRNDDRTDDSVGGAIQLFRRECFEQIGGYMPMPGGGIDAAAEIMARMHGWKVRKIHDKIVYEQRWTGYAQKSQWRALYKEGVQYHRLGYHPLFYSVRSAWRVAKPPFFLGSVVGMAGYLHAKLRRDPVALPSGAVSYLRSEQLGKLRRMMRLERNAQPTLPPVQTRLVEEARIDK